MTILISPTCWESDAVLRAIPGALPVDGFPVPAWRRDRFCVVETGAGVGPVTAVLHRLEGLAPDAVWLFGWCGGLTPELRAGDRVLGLETILVREGEASGRVAHRPPESLERAVLAALEGGGRRFVAGPVLSTPSMLRSRAQKRWGAATGAVAVEMEAGALAGWAAERSLPFVHLRVVLDPLDSALPEGRLPVDDHGHVPALPVLRRALLHPGQWPAWGRLVRQVRTARRSMIEAMASLTRPGGPLDPVGGEAGCARSRGRG